MKNNGLQEMNANPHHVATHVGIDRHTSTAAESILYTSESMLPSDQEEDLYGWLMVDDEALVSLKPTLGDRRLSYISWTAPHTWLWRYTPPVRQSR